MHDIFLSWRRLRKQRQSNKSMVRELHFESLENRKLLAVTRK